MTTEIPVYKIGTVDSSDLHIQYPYTSTMQGFADGLPVCDGSRFYYRPNIVGNPSLMYGPGSVTYEIIKCTEYLSGDTPKENEIPIDPKTYIDNYGYVHIGKSNLPVVPTNEQVAPTIRVYFKTRYHYTNPSTGEEIVKESPETYFMAAAYNDALDSEMLRSIPYAASPSNSINTD